MSLWAIEEEKRIAAVAARDAFWRMLARHESRLRRGDASLARAKLDASDHMWATELAYKKAAAAAIASGEIHPEDADNGN